MIDVPGELAPARSPIRATGPLQPLSVTIAPATETPAGVSLTLLPTFRSSTDDPSILAEPLGPASSIPAFVTEIE